MNFRNRLVNISTCLAFAGVIVAALPAFAAGEDVKESAPNKLSIAAAADLKFALDDLRFWQVPLDAYPRMEQGGTILKSSRNLEPARAFREFVLGGHGRAVLEHYGFYLPGK